MKINILILAAGSRSEVEGTEQYPPCLEEIAGASLLERIIGQTSSFSNANYAYSFLENDIQKFHLDKIAGLLTPNSRSFNIASGCNGAACTALFSACQLDQDAELLILSANEFVDVDYHEIINDFRVRELDAGTITFSSVHPRYSYVRIVEDFVEEASQFKPISKNATVGAFWYRSTRLFVDAVKRQIMKDAMTEGKFFVALSLNELILQNCKIGFSRIDKTAYTQFKSKQKIEMEDLYSDGNI